MEIKPSYLRTLSMLGQRGVFGTTLTQLAEQNENIVALAADLCNTSGLDRFQKTFPQRFYNTGIAEQNMIGIAAGLASCGKIPFAATFSNFASLRSCEQVRHFLGYMRENVKLVGFGAGFSFGMFGTTHYALEDIAALRAINNMIILSPADGLETEKAVEAAAKISAPVYLRLSGTMNNPIVYQKDFDFEIGKAITLRDGSDVVIMATGSMVHNALKAAEKLEENDISVKVVDIHTIKPLDVQAVTTACDAKLIVSVEEHSTIGGLGSAIEETMALKSRRPAHLIIGTKPFYPHAGEYAYMHDVHDLTPEKIALKIKNTYEEICK